MCVADADVVCLQEVSPVSFDDDFAFMEELGYDGKEMFKKGRFRPASFWKSARCQLVSPPVHKDRTLLTAFRLVQALTAALNNDDDDDGTFAGKKSIANGSSDGNWHVLNCHLQAGKQASRRLRQINEGVKSVMTLARKLKGESNMFGTAV